MSLLCMSFSFIIILTSTINYKSEKKFYYAFDENIFLIPLLPHDFTLYPHIIVEKSCKTIQMNALQLWYVHLNWCCSTIPI